MSLVGMRAGECVGEVFLTVIIPHFSIPDLLARCLDSIPQRDDVQVIVVDDHSPDGERE